MHCRNAAVACFRSRESDSVRQRQRRFRVACRHQGGLPSVTRPRLLRPGFALRAAPSPAAPSLYQSVPRDDEAIPVIIGVSSIAYPTLLLRMMTALLTRD